MAQTIRDGGLHSEQRDAIAEVHRSSYEPLAQINERGLITVVSQDALDSRDGSTKNFERSFVRGFMLPEEAEVFVRRVNMNSDKVAYRLALGHYPQVHDIVVSKRLDKFGLPYPSFRLSTADSPLWINKWKQDVSDIAPTLPAVFDPKWGRSATSKKGLFKNILDNLGVTCSDSALQI